MYQGTVHSACLLNRSDLLSDLLAAGTNAQVITYHALTVVKLAVYLQVRDSNGATPLHLCAVSGYLDSAKVLLQHEAAADGLHISDGQYGLTPLHVAVYSGSVGLIELFCCNWAPVEAINKRGHSALYLAAQHNKPECAVALIAGGETLPVGSLSMSWSNSWCIRGGSKPQRATEGFHTIAHCSFSWEHSCRTPVA